jgi:hypothetical protein
MTMTQPALLVCKIITGEGAFFFVHSAVVPRWA